MAGGCKAAIGCVDARVPVRASYVSLYKWPESDAEFVRSVAMARRQGDPPESPTVAHYGYYNGSGSMRRGGGGGEGYCSPRVVDSYSCRQIYLRSYTFSKKKETVPERTMACLGRVRERGAAVFPLFHPQRGGSDAGSVNSASSITREAAADASGRRGGAGSRRARRRRRRSKGCAMVRRLQEASCGAVRALFHRLLACTTSVEVADAGEPPSR
ncbi:hypothetical protein E2562_008371 [Oryza meyeriana var. granulata]|uniref:Uncharacterized protein n=1 Tax=Oryza meyeriana var. granulata TaxID=110450 RepID=A0A6G1EI11_9ORYZ|nr:hypothetical protein E2562_008371 [Oryza meyeriana var. granulata]